MSKTSKMSKTEEIIIHLKKIEEERPLTIDDIEALPVINLVPRIVAFYEKCYQYNINLSMKNGELPYAHPRGNRCVIPKDAYVHFRRYGAVLTDKRQGA
jgi:hypothetical protein